MIEIEDRYTDRGCAGLTPQWFSIFEPSFARIFEQYGQLVPACDQKIDRTIVVVVASYSAESGNWHR